MSQSLSIQRWKIALNKLAWIMAFALCIALGLYGLFLRAQATSLEEVRNTLQAKLEDQQRRKLRLEELVKQARAIQIQQSNEMKELKSLQKRITTRQKFLVTSGDKIVRQLAVYAPSSERRLLFYVPAGNHRLVYAIKEFMGSNTETYSLFASWGSDPRLIEDTTTVALKPESVYELRIEVKKGVSNSIPIRLISPEDIIEHEAVFPLSSIAFQGLTNSQNDSEVFASHPNEIRSAGDAKNHVNSKKSALVTPLLTLSIDQLGGKDDESKGRVKMRFWIDSDSKPCMSDISVAVSYDFLSSNLRYAPQQSKLEGFSKTFQPYDGSGRYYFVDGFFGNSASQ